MSPIVYHSHVKLNVLPGLSYGEYHYLPCRLYIIICLELVQGVLAISSLKNNSPQIVRVPTDLNAHGVSLYDSKPELSGVILGDNAFAF